MEYKSKLLKKDNRPIKTLGQLRSLVSGSRYPLSNFCVNSFVYLFIDVNTKIATEEGVLFRHSNNNVFYVLL